MEAQAAAPAAPSPSHSKFEFAPLPPGQSAPASPAKSAAKIPELAAHNSLHKNGNLDFYLSKAPHPFSSNTKQPTAVSSQQIIPIFNSFSALSQSLTTPPESATAEANMPPPSLHDQVTNFGNPPLVACQSPHNELNLDLDTPIKNQQLLEHQNFILLGSPKGSIHIENLHDDNLSNLGFCEMGNFDISSPTPSTILESPQPLNQIVPTDLPTLSHPSRVHEDISNMHFEDKLHAFTEFYNKIGLEFDNEAQRELLHSNYIEWISRESIPLS